MHEIERGFRLDGRLIAWGTTLAGAAAEAGIVLADDGRIGHRQIAARCSRAYGFDALSAAMTAAGGDRPVTALAYELALPGDGAMEPGRWTGPLEHAFGPPLEEGTEAVPDDATASSRVRHHARWKGGDVALGLSIFGAPRQTADGRSAGTLWLNWSHERAAVPYLPVWRAACAALAVAARGAGDMRIFSLGLKQHAAFGAAPGPLARASERALCAPDLLDTPPTIALLVSPRQVALWRNRGLGLACLSTHGDSFMWDEGSPLEVTHQVTKPAKGGGLCGLHAGRLSVYDAYGSGAIAEAAAVLAGLPGVRVNLVEDYDC